MSFETIIRGSLLLSFLWLSQLSWIQAQGVDTIAMELDPVVVTGTRSEQPKSKVAGSISVISREAIQRAGNINILPILAKQVPGFFLNDRSITGFGVGPDSGGNISMRGISGSPNNRVLVLIDGQPQFMGIFAHPIADAYSASDIERIEVIRGAASLLYGSNAMGGAINLITRKAQKEGWQGSADIGYGSYGTALMTGTVGFRKGKFHSMASVNRNQTNGYREEGRDSFENTTAYLKLGYDINETFTLSGDFQLADAVYFQPGTVEMPLENDQRDYLRGRAALSLKNDRGKLTGAILFFHNFGEHAFATGFESRDQNQGVTFYQNLSLIEDQVITFGVDYKRFGGRAVNENLPPPARIGLGEQHWVEETDVYVHVQQTLFEKLNLNGGLRRVHNSQFGDRNIPGFGFSYQAAPQTLVKASSSKAFRSPSIVDLFLFPVSNEALQPEELWNHEVGVNQQLFGKKLEMEFTAFYSLGENLIQVNPIEVPPVGRNTGSFTSKGIEAQLKYHPQKQWNLLANYSYVEVSENVLYAPRHNFNFQADLMLQRFSVIPSIQQIIGLRNSLQMDHPTESYTLINLRAMYQLTEKIQAYANGNNLLDTFYQVERGYPMPGINLIGGLSVKF